MPTAARLIGVLLPLWLASCGGSSSTTVQDTTPNQTGGMVVALARQFSTAARTRAQPNEHRQGGAGAAFVL
jgi:hypothetical protein